MNPLFKIDIIAGARPNFMKIAPIIHAIHGYNAQAAHKIDYRLIHTGQHYDKKMSESFFEALNIPTPHLNLGVGSGTQAVQTGNIMTKYEAALEESLPQVCLVVGDVTSTMACSIVAKKAGVLVVHVEGGIRSGDMTMPEEVNRIVTDSITDYFYTTSEVANANLRQQGVAEHQICFVGNTMIDSLLANLDRIKRPALLDTEGIGAYIVLTLHRPSNVDSAENLEALLSVIDTHIAGKKAIFPIHPRTRKVFEQIERRFDNLVLTDPMDYLEFMYLIKNAVGVITDSGGITEETTVLGVPCLTLRNNTERPETVTMGTNIIGGTDTTKISQYITDMVAGNWKKGAIPPLWDGKTAERIVHHLASLFPA